MSQLVAHGEFAAALHKLAHWVGLRVNILHISQDLHSACDRRMQKAQHRLHGHLADLQQQHKALDGVICPLRSLSR